jgi:hypothetical protein
MPSVSCYLGTLLCSIVKPYRVGAREPQFCLPGCTFQQCNWFAVLYAGPCAPCSVLDSGRKSCQQTQHQQLLRCSSTAKGGDEFEVGAQFVSVGRHVPKDFLPACHVAASTMGYGHAAAPHQIEMAQCHCKQVNTVLRSGKCCRC